MDLAGHPGAAFDGAVDEAGPDVAWSRENNPVVDEHVIHAATAITLALTQAGHTFGLGSRWASLRLFPGWRWLS